ncbi:unnamed protein product [Thelazia callipaeda]|uniref:Guided entry of tail-anchored proteins factor 1 n=1 Tax=Thelazia callipaeda TaxID=103827 RepID=A0A0N5D4H0_THECL|nr:unnamed protein product [Thelazia callipaeda]
MIIKLHGEKSAVLACFAALLIFTYWISLARWLSSKLKTFIYWKFRNEEDERIRVLALEVKQVKAELDHISPTAQFAAYFKKERYLKKLLEELNTLTFNRFKVSGILSTVLLIICGIIVQLTAILLMIYSRGVIIGYINANFFWPFNCLLYAPNFSPPYNANNNYRETPITLFAFLSLITFVWRNAFSKLRNKKGLKI